MKSLNDLIRFLAAAGLALAAVSAQAQDGKLEEVVVTAQKRVQSLKDVPISVSAFSGDFVQEAGIKDIRDLSGLTPRLVYQVAR